MLTSISSLNSKTSLSRFLIKLASRIDFMLLIGVYSFDMLYVAIRGKHILDADMSSEMVLADLLNKEKSISGITTNWIYSTELRFLQTQWFYRIGLLLSRNNWYNARVIGIALMLAILAFSVWLLFYASDRKDIAFYASTLALCPGGSWYFWQTIYGSYYLPYLCISLLTIALVILAAKSPHTIKKAIYIGLIAFLGISSGINGVKQLMIFNTPFVIALFIIIVYQVRRSEPDLKAILSSKECTMFKLSVLSFLTSLVGYLFNSKVLSKRYYFQQFDDNQIHGGSVLEVLKYYIWSFGYNEEIKFLSLEGIGAMIGVVIGCLTLIAGWRLIRNFKDLDLYERVIVATSCSSIAFCVFIFNYVGGGMQYFQPILPFGLFLILIDIYHEKYVLKHTKSVLLSLFFMMMIITSYGTAKSEFHDPLHTLRADDYIEEMIPFLEESGYECGVAFFWQANIITELTNGKIDVWTIEWDDEEECFQVREWLQKRDHLESFPEKFFYITSANSSGGFLDLHKDLKLIYQNNRYDIWGN